MLKKTFVCSWLLLGLLSGCPLDGAGTNDDTKTTGNDDRKTEDDDKPVDETPPNDDDDDDDDDDEESPNEETPDGSDAGGDAGTEDPGPTPDGGNDDSLDGSTPDDTLDGSTDEGDAGDEPGELDASVTPPEPDAGSEEVDAGTPIEVPDLGGADMLDADRAALVFQVMTAQNYRETWKPFLQATSGPRALVVTPSHGNALRMWINPVAAAAVKTWTDNGMPLPLVLPNGSIVVKEIYKLDAMTGKYTLNGTNIMSKVSALNEATYEGDWFYSKVSAANETSASATCFNCHNGRSAKALWPADPMVPGSGGMADAIVPYDYLFVAYCADPNTPQCAAPAGEIDLPM